MPPVTQLVAKYRDYGLEAITGSHYGGNHRNMSVEEEAAILAPFKTRAEKGELVEIRDCESLSKCRRASSQQRTDLRCAASTWMAQSNASEQTP